MNHLGISNSDGITRKSSSITFRNVKVTSFEKLKVLPDLIRFEENLENNNYKSALLNDLKENHFKDINKYVDCKRKLAYEMIDLFVDRILFNNFSWLGKPSRDGTENISFKSHSIFINFIFDALEMISGSRIVIKFVDLENIFQSLCRNKKKNSETFINDHGKKYKFDGNESD